MITVKIAGKIIPALLDTGCNTMVIQPRFAHDMKLSTTPLPKPYQVHTAAEEHMLTIDTITEQPVDTFNANTDAFERIATFKFEIAPIGLTCILGLPFFEAIGNHYVTTSIRPHRIEFKMNGRDFKIITLQDFHYEEEPDSFVRRVSAYRLKHIDPKQDRPRQRLHRGLSSVTTRRFNNELVGNKYVEAFAIHIRPCSSVNNNSASTSWPTFLDEVMLKYQDTLFTEPEHLPPDQGDDNFHIDLLPNTQPVFQQLRPLSQDHLKHLRAQLDHLLKKGWIQHS
ncbi:hypothetical protein PhCBS80983_g06493 [Powellomyces hirtus]|uniref:Uncharacterized protein n=1 Tax=Powellomyces hirtus TaxID=109895 RepID=A0A507DKW1_9FUNG|nr:hypothetical protein PhCBS80983_g06493 [Powellomyces hirtus]